MGEISDNLQVLVVFDETVVYESGDAVRCVVCCEDWDEGARIPDRSFHEDVAVGRPRAGALIF